MNISMVSLSDASYKEMICSDYMREEAFQIISNDTAIY